MRMALGLAVVLAALAGGCAGGDDGDGGPGGGGAASAGQAADSADGPESFPTACPTAADVGARVGVALELEHSGFVLGDAELLCSYEDADGRNWSASRSRNDDVEQARSEFANGGLPDGGPSSRPEDPSRSRLLDLGDEAFVDSFADPADGGGYRIYSRARVRIGVRVCAFEATGLFGEPTLAADAEDALAWVIARLCGL
jgi:hypothetical protein